jgi:7-carboxy-7-deazaguanine synthase
MTVELTLKINEIYASVQGEGRRAGVPFTFVRTTGCGLRCSWCDTAYAFYEGSEQSVNDVFKEIQKLSPKHVLLTGGEPLEQENIFVLATRLIEAGYTVLTETGGHVSLEKSPKDLIHVLDIKCPASKMSHKNHWPNLALLGQADEVKFVVADREDYDYAVEVVVKHKLDQSVGTLLFSPVHGTLDPAQLSDWLLETDDAGARPFRNARLNLQLHKYLWPAAKRGV